MADDKKIIYIVTAVANNVDRLRQSIDTLRQLHDRWKDANGSFINLIAQLTALKSHLGEMQEWINYAINELHEQLLMDLEVLMTSTAMLLRKVDQLALQLRQPDHENTDWAVKLKFSIGSKSMNRLRAIAKRQTDAVKLLLAACKCHHTAQRKILLHKSRQIRKDDKKSSISLIRNSTLNGRCINILTRISRMIQWFRVLFYARVFRDSGDGQPTEQDYLDAAAVMRSEAIDRELEEDATTLRRECKLTLAGMSNSGKELIMRQMQVLYAHGYSREERMTYHYAVRNTIRVLIHAIIDLIKDTGIELNHSLNQDFAHLLQEVEAVHFETISTAAAVAVENIWTSKQFSNIYLNNFEIDFPEHTPYFANQITRIAEKDYIPSEDDIIRLSTMSNGIQELRFPWGELDIHMFNLSGYIPSQFRKRWFHQLEGCAAFIFGVDVSSYDKPFYGQPKESQLKEAFSSFESFANSPLFADSSIILLLNNFTRFRDKLKHSPLQDFFPDFYPNEDLVTSARQYILSRFKDINRNRLSIYSFWVDLDMSDNHHLYAALKKTLLHIQQRKARSAVWESPTTPMSPTRAATVRSSKTRLTSTTLSSGKT